MPHTAQEQVPGGVYQSRVCSFQSGLGVITVALLSIGAREVPIHLFNGLNEKSLAALKKSNVRSRDLGIARHGVGPDFEAFIEITVIGKCFSEKGREMLFFTHEGGTPDSVIEHVRQVVY